MMEKHIVAYPGHAIIVAMYQYEDFEGNIAIPRNARSKESLGRNGLVASICPYPEGEDSLIFVKSKLVARPMWKYNQMFIDLLGKHVACKNSTLIRGQLYDIRLEFILSIIPEAIIPKEDELGRCRTCKSEGEANILLGGDGYCPVCGKNKYGEHINALAIDVSEEEINSYVRDPALQDFRRKSGDKAIHGNVISFPGQVNHTQVECARLNEMNSVVKNMRRK